MRAKHTLTHQHLKDPFSMPWILSLYPPYTSPPRDITPSLSHPMPSSVFDHPQRHSCDPLICLVVEVPAHLPRLPLNMAEMTWGGWCAPPPLPTQHGRRKMNERNPKVQCSHAPTPFECFSFSPPRNSMLNRSFIFKMTKKT